MPPGLKTFKPTTPSQRQLVIVDRSELWKGEPVKALTEGLRKHGGRNNTGRITLRHRGGIKSQNPARQVLARKEDRLRIVKMPAVMPKEPTP